MLQWGRPSTQGPALLGGVLWPPSGKGRGGIFSCPAPTRAHILSRRRSRPPRRACSAANLVPALPAGLPQSTLPPLKQHLLPRWAPSSAPSSIPCPSVWTSSRPGTAGLSHRAPSMPWLDVEVSGDAGASTRSIPHSCLGRVCASPQKGLWCPVQTRTASRSPSSLVHWIRVH